MWPLRADESSSHSCPLWVLSMGGGGGCLGVSNTKEKHRNPSFESEKHHILSLKGTLENGQCGNNILLSLKGTRPL